MLTEKQKEQIKKLDKLYLKKIYDLIVKYMEDQEWIEYEYKPEFAGRFDLISKIVYGDEAYYFIIPFFINQVNFWDDVFETYNIYLPTEDAINNSIDEFFKLKSKFGDEFWYD